MMRLTINIPDPPKDQRLINISFHFQDGQLVEYTAPSGWSVKEQPKREKLLPCTCGANSRVLWFEGSKRVFYRCHGCGRKVYGKNKADLRRRKNDMEIFTILGLTIFLFIVMVIASVLINIVIHETVDEAFDGLGFIIVMVVLSIELSIFFTQPEKFGYEKIVSNNFVEQEVENDN